MIIFCVVCLPPRFLVLAAFVFPPAASFCALTTVSVMADPPTPTPANGLFATPTAVLAPWPTDKPELLTIMTTLGLTMVVLEGYREERMSEAIAEWELLVVVVVLGLVTRMPSIVVEPPLGWEIEMVGARVPVGMRVLGEEVGVIGEETGGVGTGVFASVGT
jgi:hypothetical protein